MRWGAALCLCAGARTAVVRRSARRAAQPPTHTQPTRNCPPVHQRWPPAATFTRTHARTRTHAHARALPFHAEAWRSTPRPCVKLMTCAPSCRLPPTITGIGAIPTRLPTLTQQLRGASSSQRSPRLPGAEASTRPRPRHRRHRPPSSSACACTACAERPTSGG